MKKTSIVTPMLTSLEEIQKKITSFNEIEVERKSKLINVSGAPCTLYSPASHENKRVPMCDEHRYTHTKNEKRCKEGIGKKISNLAGIRHFHPSMILIILKATRVCMGHRPCQN